jgi:hypothetical protein
MQVHKESEITGCSEKFANANLQDLPIEPLIFPKLIREGVGQRCYYCWTKTGYSVAFTSLEQYAKHVLLNHEGYSIYVFDEDVDKFNEELKALRKKQMDYPKEFRQPTVSTAAEYHKKGRYIY